jgi:hypothetical protein
MEVIHNHSVELREPGTNEKEKQRWVEKHARRLQHRFEKWQKPLGIDGRDYQRFLSEELCDCYNEPLRKSLVESIS